jgi:excisionase family DNA binding protein
MTDKRPDPKPVQLSLFFRPTKNASWVARHLKTSAQTVARMLEEGELEGYKIRDRGHWFIYLDSVDALIRRQAIKYKQEHRLPPAFGGQK